MSRIKTIPAVDEHEVTREVVNITVRSSAEPPNIEVMYRTIETGEVNSITLTGNAYNTAITALDVDRLWTYIDNNS